MTKKAKFALALLKQELELINKSAQGLIYGGSDGLCLLHAMSYVSNNENYSSAYYFNNT